MGYKEIYNEWLTNAYFDADTKAELERIASDENEIKERFYTDLEFGTAGLRGIIGAGTNRMNIYTVRKATQGLANYILKSGNAEKGVAIAFDSRGICTGSGMLPGCERNQSLCIRFSSSDTGAFLCSQKTRMYCRNQHYSQP